MNLRFSLVASVFVCFVIVIAVITTDSTVSVSRTAKRQQSDVVVQCEGDTQSGATNFSSLQLKRSTMADCLRVFNQNRPRGQDDVLVLLNSMRAALADVVSVVRVPLIFFDIGANRGQTSAAIVDFVLSAHAPHNCYADRPIVVAIEPLRANFVVLQNIVSRYDGMMLALRAPVAERESVLSFFFSTDEAHNQQPSRDSEAAFGSRVDHLWSVTVDGLLTHGLRWTNKPANVTAPEILGPSGRVRFEQAIAQKYHVFLLKVDVEGYDYFVLQGASALLRSQHLSFLVFEYNSKWFTQNRVYTLRDCQKYLVSLGWWCFWIGPELIPISGPWWQDVYETRMWSNLLCSRANGSLLRLLRSHNKNLHFDILDFP